MSDKISFDGVELDVDVVRAKLAEHDDPKLQFRHIRDYCGHKVTLVIPRKEDASYPRMVVSASAHPISGATMGEAYTSMGDLPFMVLTKTMIRDLIEHLEVALESANS